MDPHLTPTLTPTPTPAPTLTLTLTPTSTLTPTLTLTLTLTRWTAELGLEQMCKDSWNWIGNNPDGFDTKA